MVGASRSHTFFRTLPRARFGCPTSVIPAKAGIQRWVLRKSPSFRRNPESRRAVLCKTSVIPAQAGIQRGVLCKSTSFRRNAVIQRVRCSAKVRHSGERRNPEGWCSAKVRHSGAIRNPEVGGALQKYVIPAHSRNLEGGALQKSVIPAKAGIQRGGALHNVRHSGESRDVRGGCYAKVRHTGASRNPEGWCSANVRHSGESRNPEVGALQKSVIPAQSGIQRGGQRGGAHDLTGNPSSVWVLCTTIGSDVTVVRFGMNRPCTAPLDSGFRRNDGGYAQQPYCGNCGLAPALPATPKPSAATSPKTSPTFPPYTVPL